MLRDGPSAARGEGERAGSSGSSALMTPGGFDDGTTPASRSLFRRRAGPASQGMACGEGGVGGRSWVGPGPHTRGSSTISRITHRVAATASRRRAPLGIGGAEGVSVTRQGFHKVRQNVKSLLIAVLGTTARWNLPLPSSSSACPALSSNLLSEPPPRPTRPLHPTCSSVLPLRVHTHLRHTPDSPRPQPVSLWSTSRGEPQEHAACGSVGPANGAGPWGTPPPSPHEQLRAPGSPFEA